MSIMAEPNAALRAARLALHFSQEDLARAVRQAGDRAGEPNDANKRLVQRWESGSVTTPRGVYARALEDVTGQPIEALGFRMSDVSRLPGASLLDAVPASFDIDTLSGAWLTSYQFSDPPKCHADIAHIEVTSPRHVSIRNYPPEPRTEGHATPYRNEIDAELAGRHLAGVWKNTNDARYFGAIHLAVLPGETVMEGFYTGLTSDSDIHITTGLWKWIRVDPDSLAETDLSTVTLKDARELYSLIEKHTQYDAPVSFGKVT